MIKHVGYGRIFLLKNINIYQIQYIEIKENNQNVQEKILQKKKKKEEETKKMKMKKIYIILVMADTLKIK